ncbi:MAG: DNA-3-methyladenine glycosylase [Phycisphaeraceae bacterium]|nr:DNA-3-methyladenine glycosylase [Phycisphaeraceae bacterium]
MTDSAPVIDRSFLSRDVVRVARALIGQRLVRQWQGKRLAGRIVETEAYLGEKDAAAHTFQGRRTDRNASMYKGGGHAYVYFTYGMHHCFNVVAGDPERPVAVLVRALEPEAGTDFMFEARAAARSETDLCSGPAKLCEALRIDRDLDGWDLCRGERLWIETLRERALPSRMIGVGPRVGVDYAGEWARRPLRFWRKDNPHVSR